MTDARLPLEAEILAREIGNLIAAYPELEDDEQLRLDSLEAETGLNEIAGRILEVLADAGGMVEAIKVRMGDLAARRERYQRRVDACRNLIGRLMDAARTTRLVLPEATIARTEGKAGVEVLDLEALPQGTYKLERVADRKAIAAMLEAGDVPGARSTLPQPGVRITTK